MKTYRIQRFVPDPNTDSDGWEMVKDSVGFDWEFIHLSNAINFCCLPNGQSLLRVIDSHGKIVWETDENGALKMECFG